MIGRYQSPDIAKIWDADEIFVRWTRVEVEACKAFHARGEISNEDMKQIESKAHHQSAARVRELEKETNHDVVAFVRAVGEKVGDPARRHLHRGLTSSDILDTSMAMGLVESLEHIISGTKTLRATVASLAKKHKYTPCAGRTHGIHAEPTTFGLKLANWVTELDRNLKRLEFVKEEASYAKLSGAVGNFSQTDPDFEKSVLQALGLKVEPIATQVVPRDRHANVFSALALLGAGIERFATEIRALQRTDIREAEEAFKKGQTGSSAMPHKRNPILCERMCGMARLLRGYMVASFENIALWHERDISHSSVERIAVPDAFHLAHYMLLKFNTVMSDLRVYPENMQANIDRTKGLLFSQNVLGVLLKAGIERQDAYRSVQAAAAKVWEGEANSLLEALSHDDAVTQHVSTEALKKAFQMDAYTRHLDALFERAGVE